MARVNVFCPNSACRKRYRVEEALLGRQATCRKCHLPFVLARAPWGEGEPILDDEFTVERKLGEGGMGVVYLVRHRSSGQRFAVKRTRIGDDALQKNFLAELQTWIGLPEHPNLATCRFVRTVGDEFAVFADYVEGGSLSEWIHDRRLGPLDRVLDIAVQVAWGLHAVHEFRLVHQDVKPGNVLMSSDGVAKLTDFGLARARARAGHAPAARGAHNILVSVGGMTEAYCSPEQAAGEPVTHKTDVWSWGVLLLEMFTGGVSWLSGQAAPHVLATYLKHGGPDDEALPKMPPALGDVLRKCFQLDPHQRWDTMLEAADAVRGVYRDAVGRNHPGPAPSFRRVLPEAEGSRDHPAVAAEGWTDPRQWLHAALRAAGRDPAEASTFVRERAGTPKARAVADVAVFTEILRTYEKLIAAGRAEFEVALAAVCLQKGLAHHSLDDTPGARALLDRAIGLYERLARAGGDDLEAALARAYVARADLTADAMRRGASGAPPDDLYNRAIELYTRLVREKGHRDLEPELARTYVRLARLGSPVGWLDTATKYGTAIEIYERLVHLEGRHDLEGELARAYVDKGEMVQVLDQHGAVRVYDKAIAIYERVVKQEPRGEVEVELARAYVSKARVLACGGPRAAERLRLDDKPLPPPDPAGHNAQALALYEAAAAIHERLLARGDRGDVACALARTLAHRADALLFQNDRAAARASAERAASIYTRLIQEGRFELLPELQMVKESRAAVS